MANPDLMQSHPHSKDRENIPMKAIQDLNRMTS